VINYLFFEFFSLFVHKLKITSKSSLHHSHNSSLFSNAYQLRQRNIEMQMKMNNNNLYFTTSQHNKVWKCDINLQICCRMIARHTISSLLRPLNVSLLSYRRFNSFSSSLLSSSSNKLQTPFNQTLITNVKLTPSLFRRHYGMLFCLCLFASLPVCCVFAVFLLLVGLFLFAVCGFVVCFVVCYFAVCFFSVLMFVVCVLFVCCLLFVVLFVVCCFVCCLLFCLLFVRVLFASLSK
jgi:hypothetical protein